MRREIEEKLKDYRRALKQNWVLFKESKIGVIGLVIMLIFFGIAIIAPLIATHDPVNWRAPITDRVEVNAYWDWPYVTDHPVNTSIGYRVIPSAFDVRVDRVYAASGTVLHAVDPSYQHPKPIWKFLASSEITSSPVAINFGDKRNPALADHIIYFGCEDGRLYALKDAQTNPSTPSGSLVSYIELDGAISSEIKVDEVHEGSRALIEKSTIYVATNNKTLYAIHPSDLTIKWKIHFEAALSSSAFLDSEKIESMIYVGTKNGYLHALNASDGTEVEEWKEEGGPYYIGHQWSSSPIVVKSDPIVIHAASDDGKLYALYASNGTEKQGWEGGITMRTLEIEFGECLPDNGVLTTPTATGDGGEIYLGSSTGYMYGVRDDGTIKWKHKTIGITENTTVTSPPFFDSKFKNIYVGVTDTNDTAETTDDIAILYTVNQNGEIEWQYPLDGVIHGQPAVWMDENKDHTHLYPSVWVGTSESKVYSYSAFGKYIAPLKPSWLPGAKEPSSGNMYILGTDTQGRDVYSQLVWGSRIALMVGFLSAIFAIGIGTVIGLTAGYSKPAIDSVLMRFTDIILVLPALPFIIILSAVMGPNIWNIIFVIAIIGWAGVARVIRSSVLSLKERPFIDFARVTGASKLRIMFKHIAPNILPLAFLYMTFGVSGAILYEAALSFIGLGDPRAISWGMMLYYVQHANALGYWWWLMPPGLCITFICLSFFLVGRAFDEIVNPRLRKRR